MLVDACLYLSVPEIISSKYATPEGRVFYWGAEVIVEEPTFLEIEGYKLPVMPAFVFKNIPEIPIKTSWKTISLGSVGELIRCHLLDVSHFDNKYTIKRVLNFIEEQIKGNEEWCIELSWQCDRSEILIEGGFETFINLMEENWVENIHERLGFKLYHSAQPPTHPAKIPAP